MMYAYIGRDAVDIFESFELATFYGYNPVDLVSLVVIAKGAPLPGSLYCHSGMATCMVSYEKKVAVLVLTGDSVQPDDHWRAVVSSFAIMLDRLGFGEGTVRVVSALSLDQPIEPARLLMPPELPF